MRAVRVLLLVATCGALLAGCLGESSSRPPSAPPPTPPVRLEGAPPELARLYGQADALLPGGREAFERRLRELRGNPVVINKWASWCGPCRAEFPVFRQAARDMGRHVAFIGVNSLDDDDAARRFLSENPVGYPSFRDPDHEVAKVFRGNAAFPTTAFYDARGRFRIAKQQPYRTPAELRADIERYAL
jgi:cytochrome c biogenesis protein CcmG/thiol:disulfide interchange protein DsbE